jgi:hypothetical protein
MVRETSLETYRMIQENGLLSKRKWETYDYVFHHGPCTSKQAYQNLCEYKRTNPSSYIGRFTDLHGEGVFKIVGRATDPDSGMPCYLWDVTKGLPIKRKKRPICASCNGTGYACDRVEDENDFY